MEFGPWSDEKFLNGTEDLVSTDDKSSEDSDNIVMKSEEGDHISEVETNDSS